jgi:hypothetical protein
MELPARSHGVNLDGAGNYESLAAEGRGHYVDCVLSIENLRQTGEFNWYGEGDDMSRLPGQIPAAPPVQPNPGAGA